MHHVTRILNFTEVAMRLKSIPRAGWARRGVQSCESVADHTFGVALLALVLGKVAAPNVNRDRCIAMALVHDLAESIVGDITPHDNVDPAEKHRREREAIEQLAGMLGNNELIDLWQEFEEARTGEARLVRDLDLLEMSLQASAYERAGRLAPEAARDFRKSAADRMRSQELKPPG